MYTCQSPCDPAAGTQIQARDLITLNAFRKCCLAVTLNMHVTIRRQVCQYTSQVPKTNEIALSFGHTLTSFDIAKKTCNQFGIILFYIYGNIWLTNSTLFQMQLGNSASVMNSSLFTTHFPCMLLDNSLDWFTNTRYLTQF